MLAGDWGHYSRFWEHQCARGPKAIRGDGDLVVGEPGGSGVYEAGGRRRWSAWYLCPQLFSSGIERGNGLAMSGRFNKRGERSRVNPVGLEFNEGGGDRTLTRGEEDGMPESIGC